MERKGELAVLPDYPETKRLFSRFFQARMRLRARQLSPLRMVPTRHYHEGRGFHVIRPDNSESKSEMEVLSVESFIKLDEIPAQTFDSVVKKFDEITQEMVRKQTELSLRRIDEDMPQSQTVDARGKKLDAELILKMFEAIQLEFNDDGSIQPLHLVGPLFTSESLAAAEKQTIESPELSKRYEELIARKREEWRAREADRKLVG
jgi:hypothetical protein